MADVRWGSLPFDEAIRFFAGTRLVPTERWTDLWQEAHDTGFMVAGAMKADLLADLQKAVGKAIERGTTLEEFRKDFDKIVERYGWHGWTGENWEGGRSWRTQVIYDTNLRMSYSAGRWAQIEANKAAAPYLLYRHSDLSAHPRPLHKSWDGLAVAVDDPWVKTHWPPNGWGCKCRMFAISARELKKLGKDGPDTPPDDGTFQWVDKVTGEAHTVPKGIDPGFGYTPGASRKDLARQEVQRKVKTLPPSIGDKLKPVATEPPPAAPTVPVDRYQAGVDYVLREGRRLEAQKIEFAYAYDEAGTVLVQRQGARSKVVFTDAEVERMRRARAPVLIHNHPGGSSLSEADFKFADAVGLRDIFAIGHNGIEYRGRMLDRRVFDRRYSWAEDIISRRFWLLIDSGEVSRELATLFHFHVLNTFLAEAGAVEYEVIKGAEQLALSAPIRAVVDDLLKLMRT